MALELFKRADDGSHSETKRSAFVNQVYRCMTSTMRSSILVVHLIKVFRLVRSVWSWLGSYDSINVVNHAGGLNRFTVLGNEGYKLNPDIGFDSVAPPLLIVPPICNISKILARWTRS